MGSLRNGLPAEEMLKDVSGKRWHFDERFWRDERSIGRVPARLALACRSRGHSQLLASHPGPGVGRPAVCIRLAAGRPHSHGAPAQGMESALPTGELLPSRK